MEQVKHTTSAGDRGQRYTSPRTTVVVGKAQGVFCQSSGNDPMREHDFGDGGFGNDF